MYFTNKKFILTHGMIANSSRHEITNMFANNLQGKSDKTKVHNTGGQSESTLPSHGACHEIRVNILPTLVVVALAS